MSSGSDGGIEEPRLLHSLDNILGKYMNPNQTGNG